MDTAQHEPTCRVRRHASAQHLLAADETSLAELQVALATLPICATGRVFVEIPDASWRGVLDAPARMVVTWLDRSARAASAGSDGACRPGDAIVRAVAAWADEMLCDRDAEARVLLLAAASGTSRIVEHLTERLDVDPAVIRVPTAIR